MVPQNVSSGEMPIYDESWWASLLEDEERYVPLPSASRQSPLKPKREENPANHKAASSDWQSARKLFECDEIVDMKVTGYNRGGLLVEGRGLYGFVPFSHLVDLVNTSDAESREKDLNAYIGREIKLKVIECVPEDGRVVFSERAAQAEAGRRTVLFETLIPEQRIWGEVTNITDFGVFIDLGGVEGLIHISELSWGRVSHPSQLVSLGQNLEVQVLEVSPERCRVALSLKRLFDNPWETAEEDFLPEQVVPAVVTSIVNYGAFARLDKGLEGLIHASEMPLKPGMNIKDLLSEGQEVQVRILHVDAQHQRMGLSLKYAEEA
jgi:small subunit ribosomal protein S1